MGIFDFGLLSKKGRSNFGQFFTGTPEQRYQQSTLGQEQQPLYQQLLAANQGQGAGGSFGTAADYYRDLLSDNSSTFNAFQAPEMRRFREDIIPSLSEQFAGMGSGGLSSSGFRNAGIQAGTDLAERLGALRAQLRQQGAQGLQSLGSQGLQQYNENVLRPQTPGALESLGNIAGTLAGSYFGGPVGASIGSQAGRIFGGSGVRNTPPYGGQ